MNLIMSFTGEEENFLIEKRPKNMGMDEWKSYLRRRTKELILADLKGELGGRGKERGGVKE